MKRWGSLAVAIAALALCGPVRASAPPVQAEAFVVQSSVDGKTLAARQADTPRAMASITKLMTMLVALERLPLDRVVTVPAAAARIGESSLDLRAGERLPVRDLVVGALVPSANDAATTLAVAAGGSVPRFVALMRDAGAAIVFADDDTYPAIADVTTDFVYARLMRTVEAEPTGYPPPVLDRWADVALDWAAGATPDDLPRADTAVRAAAAPRDVFVFFISGAKQRAPAAAEAVLKRLEA